MPTMVLEWPSCWKYSGLVENPHQKLRLSQACSNKKWVIIKEPKVSLTPKQKISPL